MSKALKIKTSVFTEASHGAFVNIFGEIIQAIITNLVVFVNLPFTVQQMQEKLQAITSKTNAAVEGSKAQKNERDNERSECTAMLMTLSAAVIARALQEPNFEQQVAIVELAKFTPYKTPQPVGPVVIAAPRAKISGAAGTIGLDWKAHKGVYCWIIQHAAGTDVGPNANWQYFGSVTRSEFTATGLSTGYHSFRLIGITALGQTEPSEGVTEYAR